MAEHPTLNDYPSVTEYLFSRLPVYQRTGGASYKIDLSVTRALDKHFGHPHRHYATLHVAGTNGKGSVSHMLASVLQEAGYRTGLYTSPHLKDFRERIRLNGKPVAEEYVTDFVRRNIPLIEKLNPSFFEITVLMAFQYFSEAGIDIAVIETGLGGRLDSTNIITPLCSVITNIGHDHVQFLGHTLEAIAREKAGIIKAGVPVVVGRTQPETAEVFRQVAARHHAPLLFADREMTAEPIGGDTSLQSFRIRKKKRVLFPKLTTDLLGDYQKENLVTVLTTLQSLPPLFHIGRETIEQGLRKVARNTGLLGRWQILDQAPLVVADTGHNEEAWRYLSRQIAHTPHRRLFIVIGFVNDKTLTPLLQQLPKEAYYLFTQAAIPRAANATKILEEARKEGLQGEVVRPVKAAIQKAYHLAGTEDMIFIGGSTFVVAEALP